MSVMKSYIVYAGTYDNADVARTDFDATRALHKDRTLGGFEIALFEKRPDGKVKVLDTAATSRTFGAKAGAISGAVLGVLFPPALIVEAAGGAVFGALVGNVAKWMSGHEVKEMADLLEAGQAGIVLIADADFKGDPDELLSSANSVMQRCFDMDEVELRRTLEAAEAQNQ